MIIKKVSLYSNLKTLGKSKISLNSGGTIKDLQNSKQENNQKDTPKLLNSG